MKSTKQDIDTVAKLNAAITAVSDSDVSVYAQHQFQDPPSTTGRTSTEQLTEWAWHGTKVESPALIIYIRINTDSLPPICQHTIARAIANGQKLQLREFEGFKAWHVGCWKLAAR